MITSVKKKVAKTGRSAGQSWAIIGLEDLEGSIEGMVFAETYASITRRYPEALSSESILFVKAKVDRKRETPNLMVNDVIILDEAVSRLTTALAVKLDRTKNDPELIPQLKPLLSKHKGNVRVYLQVLTDKSQKVVLQLGHELGVRPGKDLIDDIEMLMGSGCVVLSGEGTRRMKRLEQQRLFQEESETPTEQPQAMANDMLEEADMDD